MNIRQMVDSLDNLLQMVAPFANIIGQQKIIDMINSSVDVIQNIIDRAEDVSDVHASTDIEYVNMKLAELQTANDALMRAVEDS